MKSKTKAHAARPGGKNEFRKEEPEDECILGRARKELRMSILEQAAAMASSIVPEFREAGRRILGMEPLCEDDEETNVAGLRRAVEGDDKTLLSLARELADDETVENAVRGRAFFLAGAHAALLLKNHSDCPCGEFPGEEELNEALRSIHPAIALMMADEIGRISRSSPYRSVREEAERVLIELADGYPE
ncbi:MAG: hypothetical protein AB1324_07100 [Candidatus Micrarchaeota archaeon]